MKTSCSTTSVANSHFMGTMRPLWKIWLALIGLAFFVSCSRAPQQINIEGETMGTTYTVRLISTNPDHQADDIKRNIDGLLTQINEQMSTYDPESELSRFNQSRSTTPHVVSRNLEHVVKRALEIAEQTNGVLDVTVGPLVNLWGFGPNGRITEAPTDEQLATVRDEVGYQLLSVSNHQLTKTNPELYVDLSTIAKGYAVDRVAEILEQLDIQNYLVEIGGEMRTKGSKPDKQPWRVAIEKPVSFERAVQEIVEPGNNAIATSGDYRNYFEDDGMRFSHIIDPRTGKPIQHNTVSVTVVTDNCMDADAYATALLVMGADEALEFAEALGLAIYIVTREEEGFATQRSRKMDAYLSEPSSEPKA